MKITKPGLFVVLLLALFAAPVLAGDMILQKNGKWFPNPIPEGTEPTIEDLQKSTITIVDEDYDNIWYKFEGVASRQKLETAKVRRIVHGEIPERYREAVAAMENFDFPTALAAFDEIAKNKRVYTKNWVRMYALYNIGKIYQEGKGEWANAVAAWDRLEAEFKKSKFLPEALVKKGLAYLNMQQEDKARAAFGQLERLPGLPEAEKMEAKYWLIKINLIKGQTTGNAALVNQALGEFQRLLQEVEGKADLEEVAILARLGIGDCMLALEKYDEALSFFQKIAGSSEDPDVLAGAFNGLGLCHFKREEWKDALMAFLRTVVLYDTNPEQTAMALFYAGKSYTLAKGDEWKERARSLFNECIAKYGTSAWAKRSREEGLPATR